VRYEKNHDTCETVLNLHEAIYLRLGEIVVEIVTVYSGHGGSDNTGCFRIKVKTDTVELSKESSILESCCFCLRPTMRNSKILEELRVRRFADIHQENCCRAVLRWAILEST